MKIFLRSKNIKRGPIVSGVEVRSYKGNRHAVFICVMVIKSMFLMAMTTVHV